MSLVFLLRKKKQCVASDRSDIRRALQVGWPMASIADTAAPHTVGLLPM